MAIQHHHRDNAVYVILANHYAVCLGRISRSVGNRGNRELSHHLTLDDDSCEGIWYGFTIVVSSAHMIHILHLLVYCVLYHSEASICSYHYFVLSQPIHPQGSSKLSDSVLLQTHRMQRTSRCRTPQFLLHHSTLPLAPIRGSGQKYDNRSGPLMLLALSPTTSLE